MQSQNRNNTSKCQMTSPATPRVLGEGNTILLPYKTDPTPFSLLLFLYIPTLRTLVTLASGGLMLCETCMEIQVGLSQGDRQNLDFFPSSFTHGQLEIKSPLWSQTWESVPLVRLESRGAFDAISLCLQSPTEGT